MRIQVIGSGCNKCKTLYANAVAAVSDLGVEAEIEKVEDIPQIVKMGVLSTPALAIDGQVRVRGKVASVDEIKRLLS